MLLKVKGRIDTYRSHYIPGKYSHLLALPLRVLDGDLSFYHHPSLYMYYNLLYRNKRHILP